MSDRSDGAPRRFARDSLIQFAGSLGVILASLATSICLARGLGPDGYGAYALGITFAAGASTVAALGWSSTSIYRLRRRLAPAAEVYVLALSAAVAGSVVVTVVTLVARRPILDAFFPGAPPAVFDWALVLAAFQALGMVLGGVALGLDRFALSTIHRSGAAFGALLGVGGLVALGKGTPDTALAATAIGYGVAGVAIAVALARQTGVTSRIPGEAVRDSASFASRNWAQVVATAAHEQAGAWVLAAVSRDPVQIAFYTLSVSLVNRLRLLPDTLGMALLPRAAGLQEAEGARFTALVLRHALVWSLGMAVALGVAGVWLVPIFFGAGFSDAVAPFLLLLPTTLASTAFLVVARYFEGVARQGINVRIQLVALGVNVTTAMVLCGRYGAIGAAGAALASYAVLGALCVLALARVSETPVRRLLAFDADEGRLYRRAFGRAIGR